MSDATNLAALFDDGLGEVLDAFRVLGADPYRHDHGRDLSGQVAALAHRLENLTADLARLGAPSDLPELAEIVETFEGVRAERPGGSLTVCPPRRPDDGMAPLRMFPDAVVLFYAKVTGRKKNAAGDAYTDWGTDQAWVHHVTANPSNHDGTSANTDVTLSLLACPDTDPTSAMTGHTETSLADDTVVLYARVADPDYDGYLVPVAGTPALEVAIA